MHFFVDFYYSTAKIIKSSQIKGTICIKVLKKEGHPSNLKDALFSFHH